MGLHMCMSNHACEGACMAGVCAHLCAQEFGVYFMSCEDMVCFTDV